jgi:transposase
MINSEPANYEATITQQNKRISELENTVVELTALVEHFKELFKLSQHKRFGPSSETSANQLSLFGESPQPETNAGPKTETISYIRRRAGKRQEDLSKLPLEIVEYDIPEAERKCPECGGSVQEIGVEKRSEIKIVPARVIHVEHRRKVYKCGNCAKSTGKTPIVKAEAPEPVIKGSVASVSLISYIMTQKYLMHLPLYRLEQEFKRRGVYINRQNMANWVIQVSLMLDLVYSRLRSKLLEHDNIHSDDTGVQVLREPGKEPQSKSAMWLYRTGSDSTTPVAFYDYQPDRKAERPETFLADWCGYCHGDGYHGYHKLPNVTVVGCWAHVRRKFNDAFKIAKAPDSPAKIGLDYCDRLFALERDFAKMSPKERFDAREEFSKPVAEAFFSWSQSVVVPSKLAITRAITYALNQKEWLMNVYLDGRLELSNNRGERSVKPFVMGRKNWLFSTSVSGVKASAIAFSIIETAKENGLKPFEYLQYLLESLPNTTTGQIESLMPWSSTLPPECHNTK